MAKIRRRVFIVSLEKSLPLPRALGTAKKQFQRLADRLKMPLSDEEKRDMVRELNSTPMGPKIDIQLFHRQSPTDMILNNSDFCINCGKEVCEEDTCPRCTGRLPATRGNEFLPCQPRKCVFHFVGALLANEKKKRIKGHKFNFEAELKKLCAHDHKAIACSTCGSSGPDLCEARERLRQQIRDELKKWVSCVIISILSTSANFSTFFQVADPCGVFPRCNLSDAKRKQMNNLARERGIHVPSFLDKKPNDLAISVPNYEERVLLGRRKLRDSTSEAATETFPPNKKEKKGTLPSATTAESVPSSDDLPSNNLDYQNVVSDNSELEIDGAIPAPIFLMSYVTTEWFEDGEEPTWDLIGEKAFFLIRTDPRFKDKRDSPFIVFVNDVEPCLKVYRTMMSDEGRKVLANSIIEGHDSAIVDLERSLPGTSTGGEKEEAIDAITQPIKMVFEPFHEAGMPMDGASGFRIDVERNPQAFREEKNFNSFIQEICSSKHPMHQSARAKVSQFIATAKEGVLCDKFYVDGLTVTQGIGMSGRLKQYWEKIHGSTPLPPWLLDLDMPDLQCLKKILPGDENGPHNLTEPQVFVGPSGVAFNLHVEFLALIALNYLYEGQRLWWGINGDNNAKRMLNCLTSKNADIPESCKNPYRHRRLLPLPDTLKQKGFKVFFALQQANSFILTRPTGFHCGVSLTPTISEAINLPSASWTRQLKSYDVCGCEHESVFTWEDVDFVQLATHFCPQKLSQIQRNGMTQEKMNDKVKAALLMK